MCKDRGDKMSNKDSLKEQFLMVFSNDGHYQWANDYKKQYIFALKNLHDNEIKNLPEKIIDKSADEIFKVVVEYDKDLKLFSFFNKNYEIYSKKTIELYTIDFNNEDLTGLKALSEKNYSFDISDDWKNIGIIKDKEDNKISYIYAQSSYVTSSTKIESASFNEDIWKTIGSIATKKTKLSFGKLLYINAKVVSPKRKILKITFDIDKKLVSISYDKSEVDEQGKKINVSDSNRNALNKIIPTLPLSQATKKEIIDSVSQGKNPLITQKSLDGISFCADEEILVLPTIQKIDLEDRQTTEHSERITSEMYNQRSLEIESSAKKEYEQYGTLKEFFIHNPKHNTKNNQIKQIEKMQPNSERLSFHAYVVVIRIAKDTEKPVSKAENFKGKVLDLLSVNFDYGNNEMTIRNGNYSGEAQDALIYKILELSK